MRILEVAGSGTIFSDDMGPVSSVLFNLSNFFFRILSRSYRSGYKE